MKALDSDRKRKAQTVLAYRIKENYEKKKDH